MNQRIKASDYHVTPEFLENAWIGYSYEFTAYMDEFCERLPGDPQFGFRAGMEKASSMMQVLVRPFSRAQIYGRVPSFGNKVASGSVECQVVEVTPISATLALRFSGCTLRQVGPYRRRCAQLRCQAAQGITSGSTGSCPSSATGHANRTFPYRERRRVVPMGHPRASKGTWHMVPLGPADVGRNGSGPVV